jgi:hypothetical protein
VEERQRKEYVAPSVQSERIEPGVFGNYEGGGPIPNLSPFFGLCPPCNGG